MIDFTESVKERFIRYTKFDTMSSASLSEKKRPTTDGQIELLEALKRELEQLGLEVYFGPEYVVMGTLKGNVGEVPTIGFMAHVDTADDVEGNGVKAVVHDFYDGKDIVLSGGTVIKVSEQPELSLYEGKTIITSDGTTLLGADDKAGVAEVMEVVTYLVNHPDVKHGDIEVYFTPDEETGSGMALFPYDKLKSVCCYTLDGGSEGEVECECFNAATVAITIEGVSMHLGSARGKLVNSITAASAIISALPQAESPEATDGRYGYYCVLGIEGTAVKTELKLFIRDFDSESFNERIENVKRICASLASLYHAKIKTEVTVSYRNMAEANSKVPQAMASIAESAKKLGISVKQTLIRGGTDGARLAETGVPCPNLFTGGHAFHSLEEWVAVPAMSSAVNLALGIVAYWAESRA